MIGGQYHEKPYYADCVTVIIISRPICFSVSCLITQRFPLPLCIVLLLVLVTMIRELAYGIAGLVLIAYALDFIFSLGDDPREPPRIRSKVPLIGHLLGLIQHGPTYYSQTRSEHPFMLPTE